MDQINDDRPVEYKFPKSKLCDDIAQRPRTNVENPVANFLDELRKGILQQVERAAKEEYNVYLHSFDCYLPAQDKTHASKPHWMEDEHEILMKKSHATQVSASILATCKQHLHDSGERCSVVLGVLLLVLPWQDVKDIWYYDTTYRRLLITGLLTVYVAHRFTLDANIPIEEKNQFILYAMEGILPDDSDYGGRGLAAYTECASMLAEFQELGFSRHAAQLRIATAPNADIDWKATDHEETMALKKIMRLKNRIAFFTCADLFLDAGTWVENNLTFETAKQFGANPHQEWSISASYVRSAVSAFNEDSGGRQGRFTLTDQERKYPIHHVAQLQRKAWSTINDRSTTIYEKVAIANRNNDAQTTHDRFGNVSMQDEVAGIKKETFEKIFGTEGASQLVTLVETRMAHDRSV